MKTTYEKWIEANHKLNKCFESVAADRFKKLAQAEAEALCATERAAVASFLQNNSLTFPNLLKERLAAVGIEQGHG